MPALLILFLLHCHQCEILFPAWSWYLPLSTWLIAAPSDSSEHTLLLDHWQYPVPRYWFPGTDLWHVLPIQYCANPEYNFVGVAILGKNVVGTEMHCPIHLYWICIQSHKCINNNNYHYYYYHHHYYYYWNNTNNYWPFWKLQCTRHFIYIISFNHPPSLWLSDTRA